ncbi:unnamed protein product [Kuraishia capsulata CBS 1993]|uniref:Uncharacterized protein n=1 Tax=Kuraishia capsulata CBS 1993 TaxID=1382522 RepID=W6MTU5_9ASCO|nr:uncharacterized protein KUCA_T00005917001 [Kuraishia capsulata CBS 1993]CDK29923.1 unnamed protein product [Kuraishia capsulata CBS 1993]
MSALQGRTCFAAQKISLTRQALQGLRTIQKKKFCHQNCVPNLVAGTVLAEPKHMVPISRGMLSSCGDWAMHTTITESLGRTRIIMKYGLIGLCYGKSNHGIIIRLIVAIS